MLVCIHAVVKDLLAWVYRFAFAMMDFGYDEANMEGELGVMRRVCD